MEDKLLIISNIKKTIIYIEKTLDNFPKNEIELINNIRRYLTNMLEYAYLSNYKLNSYENKTKCMVASNMTDFCLKVSYSKKLISKKKYESISSHLIEINKMLYTWRDNEESKQFI